MEFAAGEETERGSNHMAVRARHFVANSCFVYGISALLMGSSFGMRMTDRYGRHYYSFLGECMCVCVGVYIVLQDTNMAAVPHLIQNGCHYIVVMAPDCVGLLVIGMGAEMHIKDEHLGWDLSEIIIIVCL